MFLLIALVLFSSFLASALLVLSLFIVKKKDKDREKGSPFECGFDPTSTARLPFSMRFFLITVIFLVFDVEIVLLLPFILTSSMMVDVFSLLESVIVVVILLFGTLYEWSEGGLEWFK